MHKKCKNISVSFITHTHTYIYIYIYMVILCAYKSMFHMDYKQIYHMYHSDNNHYLRPLSLSLSLYIYIYIYIYIERERERDKSMLRFSLLHLRIGTCLRRCFDGYQLYKWNSQIECLISLNFITWPSAYSIWERHEHKNACLLIYHIVLTILYLMMCSDGR